jgi:hypothetical protein
MGLLSFNAHNYTIKELESIRNRQLADALRPIKAEAWDELQRLASTGQNSLEMAFAIAMSHYIDKRCDVMEELS